MDAVEVKNITKSYGKVIALQNINFTVKENEIFGLIGPDGAGKTTLIRIITTLVLPDSGEASLFEYNVVKDYKNIRKIVGYMPQRFSLYYDLTVEENLKFYAEIFGTSIKENYHLVEPIYKQIEPFKDRKAGQLSGGMKQKLALSCALIHKPKILFLDEPTTGVDAVSRVEFWEMLKKYQNEGITILVSTPYMDEAAQCDRIAFVKDGNILRISNSDEIINDYPFNIFEINTNDFVQTTDYLRNVLPDAIINRFGSSIHCSTKLSYEEILEIVKLDNIKIKKIIPTIEDCFLWISQ
ncbi:MAG TPA: ABC transporter ATP-binding protein [Ignavibacteriales bacterium]|nr:ABC transporter ATP-binding protein [Ignavibacteriales bacterium]HOL80545.1 ABC transporter ATP-binding protein [Ignavibacteriales bacterium]HOM64234.1 ABC transporter ATP-binding protein [Ignavibacteriales bacterium]HPD67292.1 ABC transporter ATP-binding protein [Ignavibacteriales bacterium]HPP33119.1 ABC transporter ATP-binding protein [Ignavibacteriales bacterium]